MAEISIKDLNRDVARLIVGNLETEAYNAGFKDASKGDKVYALYEKRKYGYSRFIYFITKDEKRVKDLVEKYPNKLSYTFHRIDPSINIKGVFCFIECEKLCLTNNKEDAEDYLKSYNSLTPSFDFGFEEQKTYKSFYLPFDMEGQLEMVIRPRDNMDDYADIDEKNILRIIS